MHFLFSKTGKFELRKEHMKMQTLPKRVIFYKAYNMNEEEANIYQAKFIVLKIWKHRMQTLKQASAKVRGPWTIFI